MLTRFNPHELDSLSPQERDEALLAFRVAHKMAIFNHSSIMKVNNIPYDDTDERQMTTEEESILNELLSGDGMSTTARAAFKIYIASYVDLIRIHPEILKEDVTLRFLDVLKAYVDSLQSTYEPVDKFVERKFDRAYAQFRLQASTPAPPPVQSYSP